MKQALQLLLLLTFSSSLITGSAQVYTNSEGSREALFLTKVIQLDEFIHRFNNDSSSNIKRYYEAHNRPFNKPRADLIRSLLNASQQWDSTLTGSFIRRVINPDHPERLDFYQNGWYAEADCRFLYHNSPISIRLILKVKVNPNRTSQWVILSSRSTALTGQDTIFAPESVIQKKWIQPAANNTYFAELERDLSDKPNLSSFFDSSFFSRRQSYLFYQALKRGQLRFGSVKAIKYHFLQLPDWIFTVENFERETRNAGWLISNIQPVSTTERTSYEKNLLDLTIPASHF